MPYASKRARDVMPGDKIDLEQWFSEVYDANAAAEEIDELDAEDWSDDTRLYDQITDEFSEVESAETKSGMRTLVTSHTTLAVGMDYVFTTDRFYSEAEEIR